MFKERDKDLYERDRQRDRQIDRQRDSKEETMFRQSENIESTKGLSLYSSKILLHVRSWDDPFPVIDC